MPSTGNILDVAPQGEKELSNGGIRSDIQSLGLPEHTEGIRLCDQRIIGNQQSVPEIQGAGEKRNQLHLSRQASCVLDVADHEGMVGDEGVGGGLMEKESVVRVDPTSVATGQKASPADSQKQRIDAEMRLIFRNSSSTTIDPADDPRFA